MEQNTSVRENKMGTMPVGRLLLSVSLPIVISMLVQALYNVVDSIFVARISEDALAAVSLVFPVQNLMIGVGVGTGVGINSLLSRRLGEKNYDSANRVAANGLFLGFLSYLVFALVGIFATDAFFSGYRSHPEMGHAIADMGSEYMRIVTIGSLGVFWAIVGERLLQATGRSTLSMVAQLSGAVTNIILDPIMIFGLGPIPAMGVAGAAWATVIGQWVGMLVAMVMNIKKNHDIHLNFRAFRPSAKTIKHIYQVGVPSIIMQSIGSLMVLCMNQILMQYGSTPVSLLGIYYKLQSFVFMPVFGFNNGLVSIVAFNYGAKQPQRIGQTVKSSLKICGGIMLAGMLIFMFFPRLLLGMFDASEAMLAIGQSALRIIGIAFPMAGISIVLSGVFQALGLGTYSLIMSIVRQLVFLLPLTLLLSALGGLGAVWYAFPLAEVISLILAVLFYSHTWKNKILPLGKT